MAPWILQKDQVEIDCSETASSRRKYVKAYLKMGFSERHPNFLAD